MTDDDQNLSNSQTTTVTHQGQDASGDMDLLTPAEERVVRMRHGLAEDGDHALKFGLGADVETQAKLANLESYLVDAFASTDTLDGVFDGDDVDTDVKRRIVDGLKQQDN